MSTSQYFALNQTDLPDASTPSQSEAVAQLELTLTTHYRLEEAAEVLGWPSAVLYRLARRLHEAGRYGHVDESFDTLIHRGFDEKDLLQFRHLQTALSHGESFETWVSRQPLREPSLPQRFPASVQSASPIEGTQPLGSLKRYQDRLGQLSRRLFTHLGQHLRLKQPLPSPGAQPLPHRERPMPVWEPSKLSFLDANE